MVQVFLNVDVDDVAKAERFYTGALGLVVGRRFDADFVELLGAGVPIYLLKKAAGTLPAPATRPRQYDRHWTPWHLDFVVPDLEAAVTRVKEAGAIIERDISEHVWGRMALCVDPFGHGFCLLQMSERGYDAIPRES
jgi:predicted enzyme related to lactoylglutathione lyase